MHPNIHGSIIYSTKIWKQLSVHQQMKKKDKENMCVYVYIQWIISFKKDENLRSMDEPVGYYAYKVQYQAEKQMPTKLSLLILKSKVRTKKWI